MLPVAAFCVRALESLRLRGPRAGAGCGVRVARRLRLNFSSLLPIPPNKPDRPATLGLLLIKRWLGFRPTASLANEISKPCQEPSRHCAPPCSREASELKNVYLPGTAAPPSLPSARPFCATTIVLLCAAPNGPTAIEGRPVSSAMHSPLMFGAGSMGTPQSVSHNWTARRSARRANRPRRVSQVPLPQQTSCRVFASS